MCWLLLLLLLLPAAAVAAATTSSHGCPLEVLCCSRRGLCLVGGEREVCMRDDRGRVPTLKGEGLVARR